MLRELEDQSETLQTKINYIEETLAEREPCTSEDPDWQCSSCDCWKHTREICG